MNIPGVIASELKIDESQVKTVINLFDDDATIPFIARYRKEKTGGLDEEQLRSIEERLTYLRLLEERKETVLKTIEEQGKLTDELKARIVAAMKLQEVEDLYLPYRPKKKTRGTLAKQKGLEPLALFIIDNPNFEGDFDAEVNKYINEEKGVTSYDIAINGAKDIIAEMISDTAEVRQIVRDILWDQAKLVSEQSNKAKDGKIKNKRDVYKVYHSFRSGLRRLKPYQVLAINRGEREKFLKVNLSFNYPYVLQEIYYGYFPYEESFAMDILKDAVTDSFERLIYPSIEREIRNELSSVADEHAVEIFATNLRQLLLQSPISDKVIMGIDPGYVSGSKVAVIDATGKYVEGHTIYPHEPQKRTAEAKAKILDMINNHNVELIAIGNGTASRETELLVAEIIKENDLSIHYLVVSEAGASVYSASKVAKQEFPDLEASQRGNISIARRVLDPLAELVKIEPKSIGVGLYQHDVDQKYIARKLDDVVVSCVNYVGVDLNTASSSLLTYVSGLNKRIAGNIITYRESNGKFAKREQLLEVPGVGEKIFEQSAGFLKIPDSTIPFDNTFIHPESYEAVGKLLEVCNVAPEEIKEKVEVIKMYVEHKGKEEVAETVGLGVPTLEDILENLEKPGRDPREEMPDPILRQDVLKIEDLEPGMVLKGTVRNIVDFGAFVDIGVKQDGLLHVTQITNDKNKHPLEVLNVGEVIEVAILEIDIEGGRISLGSPIEVEEEEEVTEE